MKKATNFLKYHHWIWLLLVTFITYLIAGNYKTSTSYTFNWLQALVATFGIFAGCLAIVKMSLWLFLRKFYNYIYGHKVVADEEHPEPVKKYFSMSFYDFRGLDKVNPKQKWIKFVVPLFFFSLFTILVVIIFLKVLSVVAVGDIYISN
jgi:hypothetical protein